MTVHYGSPRRRKHWVASASGPAAAFTANFMTGAVPTGITYTQAAPYTYFNSSGLLVTSTGNRFDYNPVTLALRGLLIEPAATNLVISSNPDTTTNWPLTSATAPLPTLTANSLAGLDNTTTASQLSGTSSDYNGIYSQATTTANVPVTVSVYVAQAGATPNRYACLVFQAGNTRTLQATYSIVVDLQTGSITQTNTNVSGASLTNVTATVTPANNSTVTTSLGAGNGYYRLEITGTHNTTITRLKVGLAPAATSNTFQSVATQIASYGMTLGGTGTLAIYGGQIEVGAGATSLIPTTTASVTRSVGSIVNNGFSWYNASAGTALMVFDTVSLSSFQPLFSIGTVSTNGINPYIGLSSSIQCYFDGNQLSASAGTISRNTVSKVVAAYDGATNAVCFNAGTVTSPTVQASITTPTGLTIGANPAQSTLFFAGHIQSFAYYGSRLTNAQLQTLTT